VQHCDEDEEKDDQVSFYFSKLWSTGGMKLTGEDGNSRGKTRPSATLSTTNPTWTDPGSNPGYGTAFSDFSNSNNNFLWVY
jgi:hypothetical protein